MSGRAAADGGVSKVRVKRQIRGIVDDLENILGDLRDVAKELKEVVEEIDCLTSDLRLEEEQIDGSNSSSSSAERVKIYPEETSFRTAPGLRRATPPARAERPLMQSRCPQRERVRFSEKVQYYGYCPDCDLRYHMQGPDEHVPLEPGLSPVHRCPAALVPLENGDFSSPRPQKTILRKSTSTTV